MKQFLRGFKVLIVSLAILAAPISFAFAKGGSVYVHGYTKNNGTYVAPYYRSAPDGDPTNNYSYPGNTNPYTGITAGGSASSYLSNYCNNASLSNTYCYGSGTSYTTPTYTYTAPAYTYVAPTVCTTNAYNNNGTCTCISGYLASGSNCEPGSIVCSSLYGQSFYSGMSGCQCITGYGYDSTTNTCEAQEVLCSKTYGSGWAYDYVANDCYKPTVSTPATTTTGTTTPIIDTSNTTESVAATPPAVQKYNFTLNNKLGNTNQEVEVLQYLLTQKGYGNLTSGTFDKATKTALMKYQKTLKLKQTGIMDTATIKALNQIDFT